MSIKGKKNRRLPKRVMEKIRRPIPPPGKVHRHPKDYNRYDHSWEKEEI